MDEYLGRREKDWVDSHGKRFGEVTLYDAGHEKLRFTVYLFNWYGLPRQLQETTRPLTPDDCCAWKN